ncbi:MAG: ABC transporter permease [Candidatus Aureabacteria bacterium]|nr:ABC transporter permease [Candidatus Auribacterota bacterium]NLW95111.1 ABC transporter permease [Chlamydiota bacterium]
MLIYILRRILWMIPTLWAVATLAFFFMRAAPGGPFDSERKLPPSIERNVKAKYHYDEPLFRQYLRYLAGLARLDLGPSLKLQGRTVNEIIAQALPYSLALGGLALGLALLLGVILGSVAAVHRNGPLDHVVMVVALAGISIPTFVIGPLLIIVFVFVLRLLPVAGWGGAAHLLMPVLTLAAPFTAYVARLMRAGMLDVLHQPFIRAARAKGAGETAIVCRHALKVAVLPVVTFLGPASAQLLTGSVVVEKIFNLPGLGRFFVNSAFNRDHTVALGVALLYCVMLLVFNLIVDISYAWLDPRIRYR